MELFQKILNEHINKALKEQDDRLREYLERNLAQLGYVFKSAEDFERFLEDRITTITYENNPHRKELYIDYSTDKKLVGIYSSKVTIESGEGCPFDVTGRFTIKIG